MRDATYSIALDIAYQAHHGQLDKSGHPYIAHPLRVAQAVSQHGEDAMMAAVLHDVIEDSLWTIENLASHNIPPAVIEAVDLLTKRPDETNRAYLARIKTNRLATLVKIADLEDNFGPHRLEGWIASGKPGIHKYLARRFQDLENLKRFAREQGWL